MRSSEATDVVIVGGGIGGLTLALCLHQAGLRCQVFEGTAEIKALGLGINLLPHAVRELTELGLHKELARVAVETRELNFYSRHGQFIHSDPRGRRAGYGWPQFSIHRGDLQLVLLNAVRERIGADRIHVGYKCVRVSQDETGITAFFGDGESTPRSCQGSVAIGCDGIHSVVRRQLYPDEGPLHYAGITMWRGAARIPSFLTGASMVLVGSLRTGKMVIYPIRKPDPLGMQLVNWVAEIETIQQHELAENRAAQLGDFFSAYKDWSFGWLDVTSLIRKTENVLELPMVDRDPLPRWSFGRLSLLGDAAHPMYPMGSNGAGQAIIDARTLAGELLRARDPRDALAAYEAARREPTSNLVLLNRTMPPDGLLTEVDLRTGGDRFDDISAVISKQEIAGIFRRYAQVANLDKATLTRPLPSTRLYEKPQNSLILER